METPRPPPWRKPPSDSPCRDVPNGPGVCNAYFFIAARQCCGRADWPKEAITKTVIAVRVVCHMADKRKVVGDMQFACQQDLSDWTKFLQTNPEVMKIELSLPWGQWAEYTRLPLLGWDKKEGQ